MNEPLTPLADRETSSDDYAHRFAGPIGAWLIKRQNFLVSHYLPSGAKTALDVGGGHGQLVEPLAQAGIKVTVLGSHDDCQAQIKSAVSSGRCAFALGSLLQIPFADRSCDVATCIRFISHCDDWPKLVQELCRVSSSRVIIDYPPLVSFNLLYPLMFRIKKLIEGNTRTYTIFTRAQIEKQFRLNGFHPAGQSGQFFFPMGVHRLLKNVVLSEFLERMADLLALRKLFGSPVIAAFDRD